MRAKAWLALGAALVASPLHAGERGPPTPPPQPAPTTINEILDQVQAQEANAAAQASARSNAAAGAIAGARSGDVSNSVGGQTTTQTGGDQAATQTVGGDVTTVNTPRAASTAYAPPISLGSDTCFFSASAGGQGFTFGASLGLPMKDRACERRANARTLQQLGEIEAAVIYLSADPEINRAVTLARTRR